MISNIVKQTTITNSGGTVTYAVTDGITMYIINGTATLSNDLSIVSSGTPYFGLQVPMRWIANVTPNGHTVTVFGQVLSTAQCTQNMQILATYNGSAWSVNIGGINNQSNIIGTDQIQDAAVTVIKIAPLTPNKVVGTDVDGLLETINYVTPQLGGTGIYTGGSTGIPVVASGTWSVGARTENEVMILSFESNSKGDNLFKMPFAGTVTGIYAYAIVAIAGTDSGTIQAKNAAGTNMTNGLITFSASDPRGTAYTVSPSANNTFAAGDILNLVTAKTTSGGAALVTITYTRTT